jgi:NTE family protein
MKSQPTIGLALGGGAARGLAHIVVLEAFDEMGIKPDFIAGCSIGALLGAAYASGLSAAEIRDHALSVLGTPGKAARQLFWPSSDRHTSKAFNLSFSKPISLSGLGLVQLVSPPGMAKRVEDTDIPLAISTTDFYAASEVTIEAGDLETAVAASIVTCPPRLPHS